VVLVTLVHSGALASRPGLFAATLAAVSALVVVRGLRLA
jgi:hypothetical protein